MRTSLSQVNSYQAIVITNGTKSFAVFTYQCGAMAWHGSATIGFNSGGAYFENHPLSGTANVNSVACENSRLSVWTNLVYELTPRGIAGNHLGGWDIIMSFYIN